MSKRASTVWKIVGISIGLAGLVWLVFGQTLRHQFVNFDDGAYVYRNFNVTHGITIQQIVWAFTHAVAANWHPLTILSHMLDSELYGVGPSGHHLTNVILHTFAAILLFLAFWLMTRATWRSAFVAAIFAIHPLHVESVAWVAERKDVLSGVFFMLTLIAYFAYSRKPSIGRYLTVSILFICGLMSKPMLVTLPFVLLLLDYWPLGRLATSMPAKPQSAIDRNSLGWLVVEKIPFFAFSALTCVVTLITQQPSVTKVPLMARVGNALAAVAIYLGQTIWPAKLAVFYPLAENHLPTVGIGAGVVSLVGITIAAVFLRSSKPYILTGWLWFTGMLVPVIGIIQVGLQAHADRYLYLPQIGLCLIATWVLADLSRQLRFRRGIVASLALAVLVCLAWSARIQTSYWRDSESLWEHALSVTADNEMGREHLCDAYLEKNRVDDAVREGVRALSLRAESADAHATLGAALARQGKSDEALSQLQTALELNPRLVRVHYNLGNVLLQQGKVDEAIAHYEIELQTQPNFPEGQNNLANALFRKGRPDQARDHLESALKLNPSDPVAHNNLGIAFSQTGDMQAAIDQWNKTLAIQPDNLDAQCNLAWVYATFPDPSIRNGSKAVELAERALQLSNSTDPKIWRLAAAAYAEVGRFPEAIKAAQNGMALAEAAGNSDLVQTLDRNISRFQERSPLRDTPEGN